MAVQPRFTVEEVLALADLRPEIRLELLGERGGRIAPLLLPEVELLWEPPL